MKKILFVATLTSSAFLMSCRDCVTCDNGGSQVEFCKQSGVTYTDTEGNVVSWEEYKSVVLVGCQ